MTDLSDFTLSDNEYQAWQNICREFNSLPKTSDGTGLTINDAEVLHLVRAIRVWGELLSELRASQDAYVVERARTEAIHAYLDSTVTPR